MRTLFADDFEQAPSVVASPWENQPPGLPDADPVPVIGRRWDVYEAGQPHDVQVTSSRVAGRDPGPQQGTNYLRVVRDGNGITTAMARFAPQRDGVVAASFWLFVAPETDASVPIGLFLSGSDCDDGTAHSRAALYTRSNGTIRVYENRWQVHAPVGLVVRVGEWQHWEIEADLRSRTWQVTLDGRASGALHFNAPGTSIDALVIRCAGAVSKFYVDDVRVLRRSPFLYGGYYNDNLHWHLRRTTEYTSLARVSARWDARVTASAWLLRTRGQRILYDLQELPDPNNQNLAIPLVPPTTPAEVAALRAALSSRRALLAAEGLLDLLDYVYIADERSDPRSPGWWSVAGLHQVSALVSEAFPEAGQVVGSPGNWTDADLPAAVTLVSDFDYPDMRGMGYAAIRQMIETKARAALGTNRPFLFTGKAFAEVVAGESPAQRQARMPSPQQFRWMHDAIQSLNATQPNLQIVGLMWYRLESGGGHPEEGIAHGGFGTYADRIDLGHAAIGHSEGLEVGEFTFVDLFEFASTGVELHDGYIGGQSIDGHSGWQSEYLDVTGSVHHLGIDRVLGGRRCEGDGAVRVVGRLETGHGAVPPAFGVTLRQDDLGTAGSRARFCVVDVALRLDGGQQADPCRAVLELSDATGAPIVALSIGNHEHPGLILPQALSAPATPPSLPLANDQSLSLRFIADERNGTISIEEATQGQVLAADVQAFAGSTGVQFHRLEIRHDVADHSVFDVGAVQVFTSDRRPLRLGKESLEIDAPTLVAAAGGQVHLLLDAGPTASNTGYALVGSASGSAPGILLPTGLVLPVQPDWFTSLSLGAANSPIFRSFQGVLDVDGRACAMFDTLQPVPAAQGLELTFAFALIPSLDRVSNPVAVRLH